MEKITKESIFDLTSVSQPIVAGQYAFFLETTTEKDDNSYVSSIYRIDLETNERVLFGDTGTVNTAIELSPDKKKLSYLSNNTKDKKVQLVTIPLMGGSAKQVTYEENGISNYFWLEDSQTIYYQTNVKEEKEEEEASDESKDLPEKKVVTKLNYKMDSRGVTPEDCLYQIKKISIGDDEPDLVYEGDRSLSLGYVAKDESYLLYFDRLDPDDEWVYGGSVYKYDIATKNVELLTEEIPGGSFDFDLANEAEDYFIFTGNDFEYKFVTDNHVYGYDLNNKKLTDLTPNIEFGVGDSLTGDFQQNAGGADVWWLEDGQSFLFKTTEHGKITLYRGTINGDVEKVFDKHIHITGLDLLEDKNQAVITYSTLTKPSAIAMLDLQASVVTDLYDPNEKYFEEHAVSQPERFWYKSVKDWDIQGWYVPPIDAKANHPAVLYIHGGPQVSYGETFFHEMQVLASKGYGVILLNPRGGSGYGQEFVASILDNYGDEDYQDLMNGTDFVLENHPEIDENKLFVAGGSYGGFMTNWIVTHTDRFKAAVTQRSISNWLSFYGTSDIGPMFVEFN